MIWLPSASDVDRKLDCLNRFPSRKAPSVMNAFKSLVLLLMIKKDMIL